VPFMATVANDGTPAKPSKNVTQQSSSNQSSVSRSDLKGADSQDQSTRSAQSAQSVAQSNTAPTPPANTHGDAVNVAQAITAIPHSSLTGMSAGHTATEAPRAGAQSVTQESGVPSSLTSGEARVTPSVSSAQLIQIMGSSEMRVGMHTSDFGAISIRTTVSQQQMSAQIAVNHSELGSALSEHISAVQSKLGSDFGMHAQIEVSHSDAGFSNGGQHGSQQQAPQQNQRTAPAFAATDSTVAFSKASTFTHLPVAMSDSTRLDVRA